MSPRRLIPALTTLGVIAGLAAARMAVEALPLHRTARVVAEWVGGAEAAPVSPRPRIARPIPAPKPPIATDVRAFEVEIADVPGATCSEPEIAPPVRPLYEPVPSVTNSAMPSHLRTGA